MTVENTDMVNLDKIKAMVSEHFEDYLIVVSARNKVYTTYNSKLTACGMSIMVQNDIQDSWIRRDNEE